MIIAIDARAYSWAGIGRYTRNLLAHLVKLSCDHQFVALVGEGDATAREALATLAAQVSANKLRVVPVEGSYYSWREQTMLAFKLLRVRADLFHFTHFNVPLLFRKPYVVTIHDITRFIFPGQTTQNVWRQLIHEYVFMKAIDRARTVIAVSKFTSNELTRLPLRLPHIVTVHEGVEDTFFSSVAASDRQRIRLMLGTNNPFILFVGVWMSHKNLRRLLEAFRLVRLTLPSLALVITGKPRPGYVNIARVTADLGLTDHVFFPEFVPRQLLSALYAEARCLVLPSLYEGFGLPPLEAAACGTPSVVSGVTSLPEVMSNAAEYVNPEYVPGIAAGILRVLTDVSRRRLVIEKGRQRVQQFHWDDVARRYLTVYEDAVRV